MGVSCVVVVVVWGDYSHGGEGQTRYRHKLRTKAPLTKHQDKSSTDKTSGQKLRIPQFLPVEWNMHESADWLKKSHRDSLCQNAELLDLPFSGSFYYTYRRLKSDSL